LAVGSAIWKSPGYWAKKSRRVANKARSIAKTPCHFAPFLDGLKAA